MPKGIPGRVICSVEDCVEFVNGQGLCSVHLYRMKKYGTTDKPARTPRPNAGRKPVTVVDGKKPCPRCDRVLPVDCFTKNKKNASGLASWCRECVAAQRKADYKREPDRHAHYQRKHRYGLTRQQFDEFVDAHGGLCAICGDVPLKPHIDHDHKTGELRGLLCGPCNQGLGMFKDSTERLAKAIAYLQTGARPWGR